jgi:hypothetical protein
VTELVDVENRRSEGATAIPENGAVSHSVEQLDDVEMGKTFDIAVGEMASAVDDETHLKHQEQNALSCAICLSEYGMSNVLVFLAMRAILINVLRYS